MKKKTYRFHFDYKPINLRRSSLLVDLIRMFRRNPNNWTLIARCNIDPYERDFLCDLDLRQSESRMQFERLRSVSYLLYFRWLSARGVQRLNCDSLTFPRAGSFENFSPEPARSKSANEHDEFSFSKGNQLLNTRNAHTLPPTDFDSNQ